MGQSKSSRKSAKQISTPVAPDSPVVGDDAQRQGTSILKAAPAKIEVDDRELREIVNECVDGLDDELRKLLWLNDGALGSD